ncbi:Cytochrome P450 monooxygenase [Pseudocercospora fuligena]|uniref:Cytochrome P450 monooxygenase n=1 Tax=Pseudocercospora fuligena TaxID=685502 RepID=A0A8H6RVA5_9PEZI|nr:Cytochrome P450 monooxygenase [Pseudocercospora fuligena]
MFNKTLNGSNKLQRRVAMYVSVEEQQNTGVAASSDRLVFRNAPSRGLMPTSIKNALTKIRTKAKSIRYQHKIVQRVQLATRRRKAPDHEQTAMRMGSKSPATPLLADRPQYNPALYRQQIDSYFALNESTDEIASVSADEDGRSQYISLESDSSFGEYYPPGLRVMSLSAADEQAAVDEYFLDFDGGPYCNAIAEDDGDSQWLLDETHRNDSAYSEGNATYGEDMWYTTNYGKEHYCLRFLFIRLATKALAKTRLEGLAHPTVRQALEKSTTFLYERPIAIGNHFADKARYDTITLNLFPSFPSMITTMRHATAIALLISIGLTIISSAFLTILTLTLLPGLPFSPTPTTHPFALWLTLLLLLLLTCQAASRLFLSPLSHIPGPKIVAFTQVYEFYFDIVLGGRYTWEIERLHKKYGPIIRISPYELHISDPEFIGEVYGNGKIRDRWKWALGMFGIDSGMLTTSEHELHRRRRTPLNPLFSRKAVQEFEGRMKEFVDKMCERVKKGPGVVNLDLVFAACTLDLVSEYCFGGAYGALERGDLYQDVTVGMLEASQALHFNKFFPWVMRVLKNLPDRVVKWSNPKMEELLVLQKVSFFFFFLSFVDFSFQRGLI